MKTTRWCFTSWDFNKLLKLNKDLFELICIGEEIAPTTNKIHYQGFLISKKEYNLGSIKKIVDSKGHFEPAYATNAECIDYCGKEGKEFMYKRPDNDLQDIEDIFDVFNIQH